MVAPSIKHKRKSLFCYKIINETHLHLILEKNRWVVVIAIRYLVSYEARSSFCDVYRSGGTSLEIVAYHTMDPVLKTGTSAQASLRAAGFKAFTPARKIQIYIAKNEFDLLKSSLISIGKIIYLVIFIDEKTSGLQRTGGRICGEDEEKVRYSETSGYCGWKSSMAPGQIVKIGGY